MEIALLIFALAIFGGIGFLLVMMRFLYKRGRRRHTPRQFSGHRGISAAPINERSGTLSDEEDNAPLMEFDNSSEDDSENAEQKHHEAHSIYQQEGHSAADDRIMEDRQDIEGHQASVHELADQESSPSSSDYPSASESFSPGFDSSSSFSDSSGSGDSGSSSGSSD